MRKRNFTAFKKLAVLSVGVLGAISVLSACGVHSHSFSDDWSTNSSKHWHAATCEHTDEKSDEADHSYTSTVTTPATYESAGVRTYTCSVCAFDYTETIAKLEHNYSSTWSHNTTSHWHACTDEGYTDLKKDESNHSYTESVSGNVKTFSCLCGYSYTEPVTPDTDEHHFSTEWSSDETDHWHTCTDTDCTVVADKANHSYTSTITTPATYENAGLLTYSCICGKSYTEEIPQLEHNYSSTWSHDTTSHWHACTDEGYTDLKKDESNHSYTESVSGNVKTFSCLCGYSYTEPVTPDTDEHNFSTEWGSDETDHWHACTDTDCTVVADKANHSYTSTITTPATYENAGLLTYSCICGKSYTEEIPQLEHNYSSTWSHDTTSHWHACTDAGYTNLKINEAAHTMENNACKVCGYRSTVVAAEITYSSAAYETIALEWSDSNAANATVSYKLTSETIYTEVDSVLIRQTAETTARVDIIGLKGGEYYDVKIVSSSNSTLNVTAMQTQSYDRSGYAHFNYSDGVGAYNDDGTLKSGALVIYVTDANKNDLTSGNYAFCNGQPVDLSKYFKASTTKSIGYLLNNRQYSNDEKEIYGIQALTFDYPAVAIRFLGTVNAENSSDAKVSLIDGLTAYNSTDNGGSTGDNGRMVRMVNAKNLTLEGVGTDATIFGWGFHFVSNDNLHKYAGSGKSFEVRNLTFQNYAEDAIGMEGTQGTKVDPVTGSITSGASSADSDLISPVERCWIHNNTFLPGYCATPAESDKKEGDGSCDFKRGRYYTLSYNHFVDCHKTNLIGSSDPSLQYDISMHHNYWENCGSRMPLARRANIHFYNNYISGDIASGASLSYVTSARANTFILTEANYYDGCKSIVELASGGVVKSYNDMMYACFNGNAATIVSSRTQSVPNNCKFIFKNIDYSSFDTNSTLFYYDSVNQRSDCYLTDAVQARADAIKFAGVLKRDYDSINTNMNQEQTDGSVTLNGEETYTVDLSKVVKGQKTTINNIVFNKITGVSSGTIKFKGQGITFTLAYETDVTIVVSGTAEANLGELVSSTGEVISGKFTSITVSLPAGTYFIGSGSKDKEVTVTQLSFKESAAPEIKIQAAIDAINLIPGTIDLSQNCIDAVNAAQNLYSALNDTLKAQVTNASKLTTALATINQLHANSVINLISQIGTVNETSYAAINAARTAYDGLTTTQKDMVTNYELLVAAETAFDSIAVSALINQINALPSVEGITEREAITAALDSYNAIVAAYNNLSEEQKALVTNYAKVTSGIVTLEKAFDVYNFIDTVTALPNVDGLTSENYTQIANAKTLLDGLTDAQKTLIPAELMTKFNAVYAVYAEYMSQAQIIYFFDSSKQAIANEGFTVTKGNIQSNGLFTADDGTSYYSMKLESSTNISFTIASEMKITLRISDISKKVKIDGTNYTSSADMTITITLNAGTHTITKGDTTNLLYILLEPAA